MKLEDIKPGFYVAIQKDDQAGVHGRVHINRLGALCFQGEYSKVQWYLDSGWTFTRLVPAAEVEKAYNEGYTASHTISKPRSKAWEISLAKRVMEGLE